MSYNQIICPISNEKTDSNTSRLTVFINVMLMALFIASSHPVFIIIVSFDYFIRAALSIRYSPVRAISLKVTEVLHVAKKPIDLAPKIFASRLGTLCAVAAVVLYFSEQVFASFIVTGLLLVLSVMDSVFNFCVGCLIYNYLVFPFYKNK